MLQYNIKMEAAKAEVQAKKAALHAAHKDMMKALVHGDKAAAKEKAAARKEASKEMTKALKAIKK